MMISSMNKLIALLLMLCLPLLANAASSMAIAMQLQSLAAVSVSADQAKTTPASGMPCHDMATSSMMEAAGAHQHTADKPAEMPCCDEQQSVQHQCASCGWCMITLSMIQLQAFDARLAAMPADRHAVSADTFTTLNHPPAIKPPINA
ncbi:hypothetical protein [Pseudomethylobacillus aquaticus]|nr:hypothetical protein [Pseudomethylobacillus aquaticus]